MEFEIEIEFSPKKPECIGISGEMFDGDWECIVRVPIEIARTDESFDHEFGTEERYGYEFKKFNDECLLLLETYNYKGKDVFEKYFEPKNLAQSDYETLMSAVNTWIDQCIDEIDQRFKGDL